MALLGGLLLHRLTVDPELDMRPAIERAVRDLAASKTTLHGAVAAGCKGRPAEALSEGKERSIRGHAPEAWQAREDIVRTAMSLGAVLGH